MVRCALIRRIHFSYQNDSISVFLHTLDITAPVTGIVTVYTDIFVNVEPLVGTVPADNSILTEVARKSFPVL